MGTQLPSEQRHTHHHPVLGPRLLWPNGWMDEGATWYGSRPRLGHIVLDGVPRLSETGTEPPIFFGPCLLWPQSPTSATAEFLFKISRYRFRLLTRLYYIGGVLAPLGEKDKTVRVRRRCSVMSNYIDHLLLLGRIAVLRTYMRPIVTDQ